MKDPFASAQTLQALKEKFADEDLTLSRKQVAFLFDYIEALELALSYACQEEAPERKHPSLGAAYVKEALTPLPELDENGLDHQ